MKKSKAIVAIVISFFSVNVFASAHQIRCQSGNDLATVVNQLNQPYGGPYVDIQNPTVSTSVVNGATVYTVCGTVVVNY